MLLGAVVIVGLGIATALIGGTAGVILKLLFGVLQLEPLVEGLLVELLGQLREALKVFLMALWMALCGVL